MDASIAENTAMLWKLAAGAGTGLSVAFGALWRAHAAKSTSLETTLKSQADLERSDCEKERQAWRATELRLLQERDQALAKAEASERRATEELKARVAEQALFLAALRSKRSSPSDPPQR